MPQGCKPTAVFAGGGGAAQKGANIFVTAEESDVGGSLEQISYENVDGELRFCARLLKAFIQRLGSQLIEQVGGEFAESEPGVAHRYPGAGQLAQQAQAVPDYLEFLEGFAVFGGDADVRNNAP